MRKSRHERCQPATQVNEAPMIEMGAGEGEAKRMISSHRVAPSVFCAAVR